MTALAVLADELEIGQKFGNKAGDKAIKEAGSFLSWLEDKETNLGMLEETINSVKNYINTDESIDMKDNASRKTFNMMSAKLKEIAEYTDNLAEKIKKSGHADRIEVLAPRFVMRLEDVAELSEDLAENIDIALNCTEELKELDQLAERYSDVATQ